MNLSKNTLIFFIAVFILMSCKDDKDEMDNSSATGNPVGIVENAHASGQMVGADFTGRVTDMNGNPISNALVSAGGTVTASNSQGFYKIEDAVVDDQYALIKVEATGKFDQFRSLKPRQNETNIVDITLIQKVVNGFFSTSSGGVVDIPGGATVSFPEGELVTASGQPYSGEVVVASTYLDPSDPDLMSYMPGSLAAVSEDVEPVGMITYGMVGIELIGANNGQELQMAGGRKATLSLPLPETHTSHAPESIPLWYFDETAGIWQEEGVATRSGNNYVGQVSHFSFWNCDVSVNALTLEGMILLHQEGVPFSDVLVKLTRPNGSSALSGVNAEGYFGGIVPANEMLVLEVLAFECGEVLYTEQIGPFSEDQDLGLISIEDDSEGAGLIEFQGEVVDCEGNPIDGGIILYSSASTGTSGYIAVNETGAWSIALPCMSQGDIEFIATSPEDFSQSDGYVISYNLMESAAYDLGELSLCDGEMVSTYMTYNDGTNEITFTQVDLIGFEPGTFSCGDLVANVPGAQTTDFVDGVGIGALNTDSLYFEICLDDFQVQGHLPSGEFLVFEPSSAESNWLDIIQFIEGDEMNLLEASSMILPDSFPEETAVTIYTDATMTTVAEEYVVQSISLTFLVLYE